MYEEKPITQPIYYFTDYDKISDTLMQLNKKLSLRFNVRLAKKDKNGTRKLMASEIKYNTNKYNNVDSAINIKRDMDFYFSIECAGDLDGGALLSYVDIAYLKNAVSRMNGWLSGKEGFMISPDDGELIVKSDVEQVTVNLSTPEKALAFIPVVIEDMQGKLHKGIRMMVNYNDNYVDMEPDRFYRFYHLLIDTDQYACACAMINYAKMQPYGVNLIDTTY